MIAATVALSIVPVAAADSADAWGWNVNGQAAVPASLGPVRAVAGGYYHSLAVRADGTVAAWGFNGNGQCNVPSTLSSVVAVGGGKVFSMAMRAENSSSNMTKP